MRVAAFAPLVWAAALAAPAPADEVPGIFRKGPLQAGLGEHAKLQVPEDYLFVDQEHMAAFLEQSGNPPDASALGPMPLNKGGHAAA